MTRTKRFKPHSRQDDLVIRQLPEEVLIYDLKRDEAHCLNETAALVWQLCDGERTVTGISTELRRKLNAPVDDSVVWLALDQLGKRGLLQEQAAAASSSHRVSRREIVRKLGWATAFSLPLVTSIVAPTAAQAATCNGLGCPCTNGAQCCSTHCDTTVGGPCSGKCVTEGGACTPPGACV